MTSGNETEVDTQIKTLAGIMTLYFKLGRHFLVKILENFSWANLFKVVVDFQLARRV